MMKSKIVTVLSICFITVFFANAECSNKWSYHSKLLKECLDTSWWRQFYPDDSWRIRCIFVDLDNNGKDELVAASVSEEEDRAGWAWRVFKVDIVVKFRQVYCTGNIYFLCHWDSYYKITFKNEAHSVIGLKMEAGYKDKERRRIIKPTPDCRFILTEEDKFMLQEIDPDLDTCFRQEDVMSIERLYPEWYFGYDFKPPKDVPHSVYTQRMPYKLPQGDLRPGGGIGCPKDFAAFAASYRREVKMRTGKDGKVAVYAVFLDADNDGDGDCYVSSDIETVAGGEYVWTLYLCRDARFAKTKDAVYPVETRKELCKLPNTVTAGKMSFCRIIHYDVPPTFVILNEECHSKSKVRDAITEYCAHRIEKISCITFPE